ncbi:MAG: 3-oxoacyl-[acyl-carrier-protein] reductase [Dehalococcoidia bacterium]|nr:3-oxoacyl-[acyl-carrier-protein] reductase [Dehalococcoidia bacterium]
MNLEGRVALVTGASGGIGRVIARRLAAAGARVVVNYRTGSEAAAEAADAIRAAGGEAISIGADVCDADAVEAMVSQVVGRWDGVDILVNNAGVTRDRLLLRMTPKEWDEVISVNLRGSFLCTKAVLPHMMKRRRGRIVSISSVVGTSGNPGQANYAASKAGIIGFTKAMAREVASRNITVNALAPGYITTAMVEQLSEEVRKAVLGRIPMSRFGAPEDVAEAVVFLCGDGAAYITGQVLGIDGGLAV